MEFPPHSLPPHVRPASLLTHRLFHAIESHSPPFLVMWHLRSLLMWPPSTDSPFLQYTIQYTIQFNTIQFKGAVGNKTAVSRAAYRQVHKHGTGKQRVALSEQPGMHCACKEQRATSQELTSQEAHARGPQDDLCAVALCTRPHHAQIIIHKGLWELPCSTCE